MEMTVRADALPRSPALPALTGLRGIAAMAVFMCHLQPIALRFFGLDPAAGLSVVASGFRGVDLFFVLSGFILFHVHSRDFGTIERAATRRFYVLRFFRVYPLNAVVLLLLAPLPFMLPSFVEWHRLAHFSQGAYHARDFSWAAFVQSLLLAQTWTGWKPGTWNEPAWTLSAEVLGYACFPVLAMLVGRLRSGGAAMLVAVGGLSMFVVLMVVGGHATNNPSGTFGVVRMACCFTAGVALCRIFQLRPGWRALASPLASISVVLIALCFWWTSIGVFSIFGFAGVILGLAYRAGPIETFMTCRPVMWLGRISFSFYIVHLMPLEIFQWAITDGTESAGRAVALMSFIAAIALPFCLATLTYRFVELPFQRLGRHMSARVRVAGRASQAA